MSRPMLVVLFTCFVFNSRILLNRSKAFAFVARQFHNGWSRTLPTSSTRRCFTTFQHGSVRSPRVLEALQMSLATPEVSSDLDSDSEEQADEDKVSIDDTNDDADDEEQVDGQTFLQEGVAVGFFIVKIFHTPDQGFNLTSFNDVQIERLGLTAQNITLPAAMMLMDPEAYPTFSKARKESRKGAMLIHRRPLSMSKDNNNLFDVENSIIGRVGDRVYAGDVLAKQIRISTGAYPPMTYKQPFAMDIVYEDDYFAIVNKPAGVVVYAHRGGGHGRMTIRAVLPFVLKPPSQGVLNSLRRPQPVHRLDKPTQGLLLVAKTKPAMVDLTNQFVTRRIRKTYTAIINGIPPEPIETSVSAKTAYEMGVDVDPDTDIRWQLIDEPLDGQSAVTVWRALRYSKCLKAEDQTLTLVELKPKTGRYHQLRRHMAWVCGRPLAGDKGYDGGGDAMALRSRGLFLCSNRVTLEHPFYNSVEGQERWRSFSADEIPGGGRLYESSDGKVMVGVEIDLPSKFESFLSHEEERCVKLGEEA